MKNNCLTASIRNGKLYLRTKKSKKCKKKAETAQQILNSVKTKKIIYK